MDLDAKLKFIIESQGLSFLNSLVESLFLESWNVQDWSMETEKTNGLGRLAFVQNSSLYYFAYFPGFCIGCEGFFWGSVGR